MALPQTITPANAGNGNDDALTLQSGMDSNGQPYYLSGAAVVQPDSAAQPNSAAQPDAQQPAAGGSAVYFNNDGGIWYRTVPSQGATNNWTSSGGTLQARPSYVDYQSAPGQSPDVFPLTGWVAANAPAPAPTWNGASAPAAPRRRAVIFF